MDPLLFSELLAAVIHGWMTAFLLARAPNEPINRVLSLWSLLLCWWSLSFYLSQTLSNAEARHLLHQAATLAWLFSGATFFEIVRIRAFSFSAPRQVALVYAVPFALLVLKLMPDPVTEWLAAGSLSWVISRPFQLAVFDIHLAVLVVGVMRMVAHASVRGMAKSMGRLRLFMSSATAFFLIADAVRLWVSPELPPVTPLAGALAGVLLIARFARTGRTLLTAPSTAEEIVQIVSYIIVVSDVSGRIRHCNPSAVDVLGYSEDDLHSMNVNDLVTWDRPLPAERFTDPSRSAPSARAQMQTRGGEPMPVIATETVVWSELGSAMAVILIASDARELLQHEKERAALEVLRESESRFRSLIENASDLISIVDSDGKVRYQSPSVERVLGYTANELLDQPIYERVHEGDSGELRRVLTEATAASLELRLRHQDGTWRDLEATVNPIRHGDHDAMVINARDVTERKRLEAQLLQAQKMEAIGRLAGGVAHDFNNMLTAIKGYSELLLSDTTTNEATRNDLTHIRNAANRAALLTQQLLAFSRRQLMAPRIIDLNAIASDMESMLRRLIGEDIELVFHLDPDIGCVRADPSQVQQVIMNLAVNARDAMPKGGCLTLESVNVDVGNEMIDGVVPRGRYVRISFFDTGHGMSADVMSHIFEPFFTTKEAGRGTGLGLATVYGVVKQSLGYILVNSTLGAGAAFHIYLPRVDEPAETIGGPPPQERTGGTETILLVEDETDVRRVARRSLERRGYRVLEADCGSRAMEISERHEGPIHLLLTDVVMPQMSGIEVADELSAARPDMKVLYMSGYTDHILADRRLASSDHFLPKPFTPATLQDRVRYILDTSTTSLADDAEQSAAIQSGDDR